MVIINSYHFKSTILLVTISIVFCTYALTITPAAQAIDINDEPVQPIPTKIELDQRKVNLGEKLFHDPSLSKDGNISCASCHSLDTGGTDNMRTSIGVSGKPGVVNSPTVFNIGDHFMFFWDGRANTLEDQIDGPVHNPDEMASNWPHILNALKQDKTYAQAFSEIYQASPTEKTVKDAISVFEKSLITPNAPFDFYLKGNVNAISPLAQQGYTLFKSHGCASCHQGKNLGGNMFQQLGVIGDYFGERGTPITEADLGRYNVTKDEWDKHVFKVPSLRNIALTAPYFHDGSAETLEDAINAMAKYQLGKDLSKQEILAFVAFLESLTGEYKGRSLSETIHK